MLVLGIDPGTATTGFGFIKVDKAGKHKLIKSGLIETNKDGDPGVRLSEIYDGLVELIEKYKPDVIAMEKVFFFSNAKTVIRVAQAQGIVLLAADRCDIPLFEYAPAQVKLNVSGSGRADKKEMQAEIFRRFKITHAKGKKTHFDNEADALAIAVCHAIVTKMKEDSNPSLTLR